MQISPKEQCYSTGKHGLVSKPREDSAEVAVSQQETGGPSLRPETLLPWLSTCYFSILKTRWQHLTLRTQHSPTGLDHVCTFETA